MAKEKAAVVRQKTGSLAMRRRAVVALSSGTCQPGEGHAQRGCCLTCLGHFEASNLRGEEAVLSCVTHGYKDRLPKVEALP